MLEWFKKLFEIHRHEWKVIEKVKLIRKSHYGNEEGQRFVLQCQTCGDVKKDLI